MLFKLKSHAYIVVSKENGFVYGKEHRDVTRFGYYDDDGPTPMLK